MIRNTLSSIISAIFAPVQEPANANRIPARASFTGIYPFCQNLHVATAVPIPELSLFVPIAVCTGSPAIKYAGKDINPPPPAIASTNPAKKTSGHTIKNSILTTRLFYFLFYSIKLFLYQY